MRTWYVHAFAACIYFASASGAWACQKVGSNWFLGSNYVRTWTVKRGEVCPNWLTTGSGHRTGSDTIDSMRIVKRPSHGTVGTAGTTHYAYKASSTYLGKDYFEIEITGMTHGKRATTLFMVDVNVVP